jgi:hypothetical protein
MPRYSKASLALARAIYAPRAVAIARRTFSNIKKQWRGNTAPRPPRTRF